MAISSSAPNIETFGQQFTLECYANVDHNPSLENVPTPYFEWFFDSNNDSLPSGVTVSPVTKNGNTYTSSIQFSPLHASHAGVYTCRLGGNERLAAKTMINVNTGIASYQPHCIICISTSSPLNHLHTL